MNKFIIQLGMSKSASRTTNSTAPDKTAVLMVFFIFSAVQKRQTDGKFTIVMEEQPLRHTVEFVLKMTKLSKRTTEPTIRPV